MLRLRSEENPAFYLAFNSDTVLHLLANYYIEQYQLDYGS
jgi:hypothetical protein